MAGAAVILLQACAARTDAGQAAIPADEERGRLLYETACVACHTTQAHWRDKRIVRSWPELVRQVTRWQHNAGQNWQSADIVDVAAHLNGRFYNLPCPVPGCGGPQAVSQAGR